MQETEPRSRPAGALSEAWNRVTDVLGGRTPTTAAGVDRVVALIIAGIRAGILLQMAPSLRQGVEASPQPVLYGICFAAAVVMSIVVSGVVLIRDSPGGRWLHGIDVAVACVLLLLGDFTVPPDYRIGSWVGFQPAYALSVLCAAASVPGRWNWLVYLVGISGCDLWFRYFRLPENTSQTFATSIGNVLTYVVLVSVARVAAAYLRRVAADGDAARAQAAELARRDEERRAQLAFHNGAAVMRLLADPDLDPRVRSVLQAEAARESVRMRSYLQGDSAPLDRAEGGARMLVDQVRATCARYGDLPLNTALDLAEGVRVPDAVAAALDHALAALLLNARDHSEATRVVVHGDSVTEADSTRWVLTVHDNGRGFDADPDHWGVGLREVVHAQLRDLGVEVELTSKPGLGSTVLLRGVVPAGREASRG